MGRLALACCRGAMMHSPYLEGGKGSCSNVPRDGSQSNHHNTSRFKSPFPGNVVGLFINITYK